MSGENWTPGPWRIGLHTEGCCYYVGPIPSAGDEVATIYGSYMPDLQEANTNLIAAAPELYKALKALLCDYKDAYDEWADDVQADKLSYVIEAQSALAKARGEQPWPTQYAESEKPPKP